MAAGLLLGIMVLDILLPGRTIALSPLFALSPMAACVALSVRQTSTFALAATVAGIASGLWNDTFTSPQHLVRILDVVVMSLAAVAVAGIRVRQQRQLGELTVLADVAQRAILPVVPAHVRRTNAAVRYQSATKDTVMGGDLYDCYHSRSHTRFLIGDVRGKGIGAVEQAARVIRAFRQAAALQPSLGAVAQEMSNYLHPFFEDEEFVTAVLVDTTTPGRIQVVNAGHPAPLLIHPDRTYEFLESDPDLPLGLGPHFTHHEFTWQPGDRLFLYTDGVSEARNVDGVFLDVATLAPVLAGQPLNTSLDALLRTIRGHSVHGELSDDVAVILLEHTRSDLEDRGAVDHNAEWLGLLNR